MNTDTIPVQTGPLYTCFACGAPAVLDCYYGQFGFGGHSPLNDWTKHIWYLKKDCQCQPKRVVRLGDCITPLIPSEPHGLTPADIPAIRAGLQAIARAVPPEVLHVDPVTRIVHGLLAATITPHEAVTQLHALTPVPQPEPPFRMPAFPFKPTQPAQPGTISFISEGAPR